MPALWEWTQCPHTTMCIGKASFDETREQYWEIINPSISNSIGIIDLYEDKSWLLTGSGVTMGPGINPRQIGNWQNDWCSSRVGLLWNPAERAISLFVNDTFQSILWRDIPRGFCPRIDAYPWDGCRIGRRTQGIATLHDLCEKRVADLVRAEDSVEELPLPQPVRRDLATAKREASPLHLWLSRSGTFRGNIYF